MASYMSEILEKLGWQDGFQIPVANAENQELEQELAKLHLQKIKGKTAFEAANSKFENLENHLKYVQQESEQTQKLISVHVQQVQSEEHSLRLSVAEKEKINQEIRQYQKTAGDVKERQEIKRNTLAKCVAKLEKMKAEAHWDTEALRAWEESLKKRDDDIDVIKKFSKEDELKYNELEAKRQILEVEFTRRRQTVEKMVCDIKNYERILERTGKVMKEQFVERDALVKQWKDSVKILHQRDKDIERLQNQILQTQELVDKQLEKLDEQNLFYENEIRNNQQIEFENEALNQQNSRVRREYAELQQYVLLLANEIETARKTMTTTAKKLEQLRIEHRQLLKDIDDKERKVEAMTKDVEKLREKNNELDSANLTAADRARHLQKLIDYEEKHAKQIMCENETMQGLHFKAKQELLDLTSKGKMLENFIESGRKIIVNLTKHNKEAKKNVDKQKEVLYDLNFKVNEMQRKIAVSEEVTFSDNHEELEQKLEELRQKKVEVVNVKEMLRDQVNKISEDMRRLTLAISTDRSLMDMLKEKLNTQELNYEGGRKQLEQSKAAYQEYQVEENMLRLKVDQLEKAMKKQEKNIFTLQKFRVSLEQAMMERLVEINANRDILLVKRRNLNEDKGRLKADLVECQLKSEIFQKKYDLIISTFGQDESGKPLSITHFKIKNAQEKFLLQKEGDELDNKIKKAEKEIVAMENTLKLVNVTNVAFKKSLSAIDEEGEEMSEMRDLEEQMFQANDQLRKHRDELNQKRQDLKEIQSKIKELSEARDKVNQELETLEAEFYQVETEKQKKDEKLRRTEDYLDAAKRKISKTQIENYERDLEIRQIREANKSVLQKLAEISVRYQEMAPLVKRYASEHNISLPEKPFSEPTSESTISSQSWKITPPQSVLMQSPISSKSSVRSERGSTTSSIISKVTLTLNL